MWRKRSWPILVVVLAVYVAALAHQVHTAHDAGRPDACPLCMLLAGAALAVASCRVSSTLKRGTSSHPAHERAPELPGVWRAWSLRGPPSVCLLRAF